MSDIKLGSQYYAYWTLSKSGIAATGFNPRVLVFSENDSTPIYTGGMTGVLGFTGVYRTNVPVFQNSGFFAGNSYSLWATGIVSGSFPIRQFIGRLNVKSSLFDGASGIGQNSYSSIIKHTYLKPSGLNLFTVMWLKNGVPYPIWSNGIINVFDSGGNPYISNSGLTAYGAGISGGLLVVGGNLVLKSGERYIGQTIAVIDGATRYWQDHIGYDV